MKDAKKDKKAERVRQQEQQQHCPGSSTGSGSHVPDHVPARPSLCTSVGHGHAAAFCVCPLIPLPFVAQFPAHSLQAAQRGVKQAAPTQADPDDPCAANYGDYAMVQSTEISGRKWTKVEQLTPDLAGQKVKGWRHHWERLLLCNLHPAQKQGPALHPPPSLHTRQQRQ